jgi:alanyl-tRNA synthetase
MQSNEIRQKYLKFFEKRGHTIIPSASLVPENDPSVLFNTAGMQPLVPYLLGEKHPAGTRLVDVQKCVRTGDIEEVGDNRHLTFFEMLGNWSLGDYFKKESIQWSFEFLTDKVDGLGLDINRIYVTVFEGDENAPRDNEAAEIWKKYLPEGRIYFLPAKNNWWSAGENGPCGPDTEIFYDPNEQAIGDMTHDQFVKADDEGRVVEIWNNVFMEYQKKDGKVVGKLAQHNVDTGMGLERITMVSQKVKTVFDTDLFQSVLFEIKKLAQNYNEKSARVIADHVRAATFLISDGVTPSNTDQGYILRRLLRRAVRCIDQMGLVHENNTDRSNLAYFSEIIVRQNAIAYPNLATEADKIFKEIEAEEEKFRKTLVTGLKEFEKIIIGPASGIYDAEISNEEINQQLGKQLENMPPKIPGIIAFRLFTTFGFPIELTIEIAKEKGMIVDTDGFDREFKKHQELSRAGAEQKFKGGLASTGEQEIKYHTATHLLNAALRQVLGPDVHQKGSNITAERLRFDFSYPEKLSDEQKKKVEDYVNGVIALRLPVTCKEMKVDEAKASGAEGVFTDKYDALVKVYTVGPDDDHYSKEICGGPHVANTGELGRFKIQKEEASSAGVRRIKAVLE